jgi:Zn-dependent protease
MQGDDPILIVFQVAILIFSVIAHEVSHGYMAQYLGDPTARLAGRLTLNPMKHIDPIGSVLVPIFTVLIPGQFVFGWAKPVPYNPYNLRDQKWGDTKVALAGPLTNFGIALFFGLLLRFGSASLALPMIELIQIIVIINIMLGVFNAVPIPPLDGSKVLLNALPYRYRFIYNYLERYSLVFILIFAFYLWKYLYPVVEFIYDLFVGNII